MITEELNQSQQQALLQAGMDALSKSQELTFEKYNRAVLPLDGYVFWIKDAAAAPRVVNGVFHYATDQQQNDDETIGKNRVVFTTQTPIQGFNGVGDAVIWIAAFDGIRFAFNARKNLFAQAATYHYSGEAINPVMASQIIDNPLADIALGGEIAANSLPLWIGFNSAVQLYPAMLVPGNLTTAYGAIEISNTSPLQAQASIDAQGNRMQMLKETVKITFYGLRNNSVLDFLDSVIKYAQNYDALGIVNMPFVQDEKRGQSELGILAQKKSIEFEVTYYQARMAGLAQQQILSAIPSYTFN